MESRIKEKQRYGFHMSISNGLLEAVNDTAAMGCTSMQIFSRNPRSWKKKRFKKELLIEFRNKLKKNDISPLVIHSIYLINACSDDLEIYRKSRQLLLEEARNTERLNGDFLVLHPGSCKIKQKGIKRLASALDIASSILSGNKKILIENVAGGGHQIGKNFEEMKMILDKVKNPDKIGFCIDTCHLFAYGFNLRIRMNVMSMFSEINETIGLDKINLIHLNDSKFDLSLKRDQHEHLGDGFIGFQGLKNFLNSGFVKGIPIIMETPKDNPDSDKKNLQTLLSILNGA
ncbi:MAG: deoxyribonuclease IV [bacterium]|nr:deoxyribonuclease IV [bacterium]